MDLTKIEAISNVLVYGDFLSEASSTFRQRIDVQFLPDYVIVKGISYWPDDDDFQSNVVVYTDLLGGFIANFLVCADPPGTVYYHIHKQQI